MTRTRPGPGVRCLVAGKPRDVAHRVSVIVPLLRDKIRLGGAVQHCVIDPSPRAGCARCAPLTGQPASLHDIVRQPETRMPDMPNQLVQARIDGAIKEEAATVLAAMGLTVSGALRLLLTKVAHEKALPFAPLVPNAATIEAMREARRGNLPQFASVEDLFDDLRADD